MVEEECPFVTGLKLKERILIRPKDGLPAHALSMWVQGRFPYEVSVPRHITRSRGQKDTSPDPSNEVLGSMTAWCNASCTGEWLMQSGAFRFQNQADAALFRLWWT